MTDKEALIRSFGFELVHERSEALSDEEEPSKSFSDVALTLGESSDQGLGTVLLTSRRLIWLSNADPAFGAAISFQSISLHAISQAEEVYHKPCIYMQLEIGPSQEGKDSGSEQEDEDDGTAEARLVPADSSILEDFFQALCDSAAMNPDSGMEDNDGEGEFFYDEDEVLAGASDEQRADMLDHLDSLLQMPRAADLDELLAEDPERFEDADEVLEEDNEAHPNGHGKH